MFLYQKKTWVKLIFVYRFVCRISNIVWCPVDDGTVFTEICFNINTEFLTLFRTGGKKAPTTHPPTSFSPLTSASIGISSQNILTFSLNPYLTLVQNLKAIIFNSKLLNLNQEHPSKNWFFWSSPYKIEVMITSVIKMFKLPNFSHVTASAV